MVASGFFAGALIRTFFAPPAKWSSAFSRLVKNPVDSRTTSTPRSFHGSLRRVALFQDPDLLTADDDVLGVVADLAVEFPMDGVPLEQMREGMGVGEIVDRADLRDLVLRHGAQDVAPDAAEAVDAEVCHRRS